MDSAVMRLRSLTPEARDQIICGIETIIECIESSKSVDCDKTTLENKLKEKYDEIRALAKVSYLVNNKETLITAVARVLNRGSYEDGASAVYKVAEVVYLCNLLESKNSKEVK